MYLRGHLRALLALAVTAFVPFGAMAGEDASERRSAAVVSYSSSAILIDGDDRLAPLDFARANGLTPVQLQTRFGATGIVRCGAATGTAQLVGSNNVIVTAAHVLLDENGRRRAEGSDCTFVINAGDQRQEIALVLDEAITGASAPYAEPAVRDWAVVPLAASAYGARPYHLATTLDVPSAIVLSSAARASGEWASLERCQARNVTAQTNDGLREVAIDCDAEGGTSGSAILSETGGFLGVYVGFRSAHPGVSGPFSATHYNFAVTAEGALRRAVMEVVSQNQPLSASR